MAFLRVPVGFVRLTAHALTGLAVVLVLFPWAGALRRFHLVRWWSRGLLRICGMDLRVEGHALRAGHLLVANHVSWLDIAVLHAAAPAQLVRFVAKSEIRSWPLIGFLAARAGTLFIERGRRHAVHRANAAIGAALAAGDCVALFPEGTTGDGLSVLPFHANLFQSAVEGNLPVQPVALQFLTAKGAPTTAPSFAGDVHLIGAMRATLRGAPYVVRVTYLPAIPVEGRSRHEVGAAACQAIALSLGFDAPGIPPERARGPRAAAR